MIEFYQDCSYNGGGQSICHPYFFWLVGLPIVFIGSVGIVCQRTQVLTPAKAIFVSGTSGAHV